MVRSLYESLCNMESIYADRVAIRYFDEVSAQVVEIPTAAMPPTSGALLPLSAARPASPASVSLCWPATAISM